MKSALKCAIIKRILTTGTDVCFIDRIGLSMFLLFHFSIKALVMFLLASFAIGWRAQLLSAGRLTFCIFNTFPHVYLVVVLVFI